MPADRRFSLTSLPAIPRKPTRPNNQHETDTDSDDPPLPPNRFHNPSRRLHTTSPALSRTNTSNAQNRFSNTPLATPSSRQTLPASDRPHAHTVPPRRPQTSSTSATPQYTPSFRRALPSPQRPPRQSNAPTPTAHPRPSKRPPHATATPPIRRARPPLARPSDRGSYRPHDPPPLLEHMTTLPSREPSPLSDVAKRSAKTKLAARSISDRETRRDENKSRAKETETRRVRETETRRDRETGAEQTKIHKARGAGEGEAEGIGKTVNKETAQIGDPSMETEASLLPETSERDIAVFKTEETAEQVMPSKKETAHVKERVQEGETADVKERREETETAPVRQRYMQAKTSPAEQKYKKTETAKVKERASETETAKVKERASETETAKVKERASETETAKVKERASETETAKVKERASETETAKVKSRHKDGETNNVRQRPHEEETAVAEERFAETGEGEERESLSETERDGQKETAVIEKSGQGSMETAGDERGGTRRHRRRAFSLCGETSVIIAPRRRASEVAELTIERVMSDMEGFTIKSHEAINRRFDLWRPLIEKVASHPLGLQGCYEDLLNLLEGCIYKQAHNKDTHRSSRTSEVVTRAPACASLLGAMVRRPLRCHRALFLSSLFTRKLLAAAEVKGLTSRPKRKMDVETDFFAKHFTVMSTYIPSAILQEVHRLPEATETDVCEKNEFRLGFDEEDDSDTSVSSWEMTTTENFREYNFDPLIPEQEEAASFRQVWAAYADDQHTRLTEVEALRNKVTRRHNAWTRDIQHRGVDDAFRFGALPVYASMHPSQICPAPSGWPWYMPGHLYAIDGLIDRLLLDSMGNQLGAKWDTSTLPPHLLALKAYKPLQNRYTQPTLVTGDNFWHLQPCNVWPLPISRAQAIQLHSEEKRDRLRAMQIHQREAGSAVTRTDERQARPRLTEGTSHLVKNLLGPSEHWAKTAMSSLGAEIELRQSIQCPIYGSCKKKSEEILDSDTDVVWTLAEIVVFIDRYFDQPYKSFRLGLEAKTTHQCTTFFYAMKHFLKLRGFHKLNVAPHGDQSIPLSTHFNSPNFAWPLVVHDLRDRASRRKAISEILQAQILPIISDVIFMACGDIPLVEPPLLNLQSPAFSLSTLQTAAAMASTRMRYMKVELKGPTTPEAIEDIYASRHSSLFLPQAVKMVLTTGSLQAGNPPPEEAAGNRLFTAVVPAAEWDPRAAVQSVRPLVESVVALADTTALADAPKPSDVDLSFLSAEECMEAANLFIAAARDSGVRQIVKNMIEGREDVGSLALKYTVRPERRVSPPAAPEVVVEQPRQSPFLLSRLAQSPGCLRQTPMDAATERYIHQRALQLATQMVRNGQQQPIGIPVATPWSYNARTDPVLSASHLRRTPHVTPPPKRRPSFGELMRRSM